MSFSVMHAGTTQEVSDKLGAKPHPQLQYGRELGELTQTFLRGVVDMIGPEYTVVVEASGHGEPGSQATLDIRIRTTR